LGERWDRIDGTVPNFARFRGLFPPSRLAEHDRSCHEWLNKVLDLTQLLGFADPLDRQLDDSQPPAIPPRKDDAKQ
jgi:hypothetical protein